MSERKGIDIAQSGVGVLLAIVFLFAGIPKLFGASTAGLQAAAMHGFPTWIRVVIGVVEVCGAIGLLLRPVASFAAIGLALLMIPAFVTQRLSGEGGLYVAVVIFVALLFVAWGRERARVSSGYRAAISPPRPLERDGRIAGVWHAHPQLSTQLSHSLERDANRHSGATPLTRRS